MTHEAPEPIRDADVQLGWEPIADFGRNLEEAKAFYLDLGKLPGESIISVSRRGELRVWVKVANFWTTYDFPTGKA